MRIWGTQSQWEEKYIEVSSTYNSDFFSFREIAKISVKVIEAEQREAA